MYHWTSLVHNSSFWIDRRIGHQKSHPNTYRNPTISKQAAKE